MADKSRLQIVGWLFGGMTAAVMVVVAALLVSDAGASNPNAWLAGTDVASDTP